MKRWYSFVTSQAMTPEDKVPKGSLNDEFAFVRLNDAEAEIVKARRQGYDDGIRHGKTFARTETANDVAGEVWDMLSPHLKPGTHVDIYDAMRKRFPQLSSLSICESCGNPSSLRERWTSMEAAGPLDLFVCAACAYHLKDAHWSNGPRTRKA